MPGVWDRLSDRYGVGLQSVRDVSCADEGVLVFAEEGVAGLGVFNVQVVELVYTQS